ncbi:LPS assembly lipoprotein LptE [Yoonia sp. F2084L]|uniref:LPS assembly lipoprotein LptE n=1 Tax=Yoonia sp. F2084L TaxID=2926419 RepID=UPI001FF6A00B|nr:LPS assembly lipoprotein LptE [Yoonia sp. F2084L]MCK0096975.1 LPS assembly lipoprotein LptE [Yoonia sp. F2084L]
MSSNPITRRATLISLLGLMGCGFAPIYGAGNGLRDRVRIEADDSVAGFKLQERLEARLGRSSAPQYVLKTTVRSSERAAAITADGDTSRLNIIGTATWSLVDIARDETIESGAVDAFTSYSATGSTIATQATRDDAEARLSVILADMIVSRVLVITAELPQ